MAREQSGGGHEVALTDALAEALGDLDTGPEPTMPDLVTGALTRGARIRRRYRVRVALGTAAMAAVVAVGGYGMFAPARDSRRQVLSAEASSGYPSLALLRAIVPASSGTVDPAPRRPAYPKGPEPYFLLTERNGLVSDLYVSVSRSSDGLPTASFFPPPSASSSLGRGLCHQDVSGRPRTSPWGGTLVNCSPVAGPFEGTQLQYYADEESPSVPRNAELQPYAMGLLYAAPDGRLVQVFARPHYEEGGRYPSARTPNRQLLAGIATDPRLLEAIAKSGGRTQPEE